MVEEGVYRGDRVGAGQDGPLRAGIPTMLDKAPGTDIDMGQSGFSDTSARGVGTTPRVSLRLWQHTDAEANERPHNLR